MADEIELKLALPESAHRRFLAHPLLKQAQGKNHARLVNLYYDTPNLDLHSRGIALRLRQKGNLWLQTVKCAGEARGGLSARPEWETPYSGHFDFSPITDEKVRRWLDRPAIRHRLTAILETNFRRTTWHFEPRPGEGYFIMLDRGWITANGRHEDISEVEIELAGAPLAALFDSAWALSEKVPLTPSILSKAERGYRLFLGEAPTPTRAGPVPLSSALSPREAFRKIGLGCLDHLQANHYGATHTDDPEYIHQMRVALRRLRAAIRLFLPHLPAGLTTEILPPLRQLTAMLGTTRDLDVLQTEIVGPVVRALPDEPRLAALAGLIAERQHDARTRTAQLLQEPAYGRLMLTLLHHLQADVLSLPEATEAIDLRHFAHRRLRRLQKRTLALALDATPADPPALHRLRIAIKRWRYGLDFLSPLFGKKAWGKLEARLARLQDQLGQLNDLANAGDTLMRCADDDAALREAVTLIAGWHGPRYADLLVEATKNIGGLKRIEPILIDKQ